ncbi:MAG: response regulator [candidate division Zixibacteria bacterium]|nr:response regulator [candidate division Zixibacteria bacterium]MDH3938349.1 response regulator [candidate division Zixibacteria bacterium]MDH4032720.1 response regulator [candidate division Zixibacteria bacterium]
MDNPSILVVDDELLIRDLLYDFFHDQGWDITVAESGQKALDIMQERQFDVLLTDLRMPAMDGMTLTSQVQQDYPDVPVVIMTGYPSVDSAVAALRTRVADYITKPFNVNDLFKRVLSHLPKEGEGAD